jgi:hypothetical protein
MFTLQAVRATRSVWDQIRVEHPTDEEYGFVDALIDEGQQPFGQSLIGTVYDNGLWFVVQLPDEVVKTKVSWYSHKAQMKANSLKRLLVG